MGQVWRAAGSDAAGSSCPAIKSRDELGELHAWAAERGIELEELVARTAQT